MTREQAFKLIDNNIKAVELKENTTSKDYKLFAALSRKDKEITAQVEELEKRIQELEYLSRDFKLVIEYCQAMNYIPRPGPQALQVNTGNE